jgi:hypothetical protein
MPLLRLVYRCSAPHRFQQSDNRSAMVGVIDSIRSEDVGLCWSCWQLAMGSGRNAATVVLAKNIVAAA